MDEETKLFKIPSWAKNEAPVSGVSENYSDIYEELNAINEEIEKCRLENSQD